MVILDVISTLGVLAAAILAAFTIMQAKRQAAESQRALLLERRVNFELGVLARLQEQIFKPKSDSGVEAVAKGLAALLPYELIPTTHASYGLRTTQEVAQESFAKTGNSGVPLRNVNEGEVRQELLDAVASLMGARAALSIREVSGPPWRGSKK
ncbi:MAG: hypothetical protein QOI06_221 [Nocardioidaceae bacterium]|nr:hypothetical protein [Nocardioidaceae bacterium]